MAEKIIKFQKTQRHGERKDETSHAIVAKFSQDHDILQSN